MNNENQDANLTYWIVIGIIAVFMLWLAMVKVWGAGLKVGDAVTCKPRTEASAISILATKEVGTLRETILACNNQRTYAVSGVVFQWEPKGVTFIYKGRDKETGQYIFSPILHIELGVEEVSPNSLP